jgi:hypothetical protein
MVACACTDDPDAGPASATTDGDTDATEPAAVDVTVSTVPVVVDEPVAMDAVAAFGDGVRARIVALQATDAVGRLPGERSGPAVLVTVEVENASAETINLDLVVVDLSTGEGVPANLIADPEQVPLQGELPPGETREGAYLFTMPLEDRDDVRVSVAYSADAPTVVFAGGAPSA